jgi:hypothetical protein
MAQFNETELTAAVVKSFENTPDPRAKFLLQELVKSLHDYVRRTDLTFRSAARSGKSSSCCPTLWAFPCWSMR